MGDRSFRLRIRLEWGLMAIVGYRDALMMFMFEINGDEKLAADIFCNIDDS